EGHARTTLHDARAGERADPGEAVAIPRADVRRDADDHPADGDGVPRADQRLAADAAGDGAAVRPGDTGAGAVDLDAGQHRERGDAPGDAHGDAVGVPVGPRVPDGLNALAPPAGRAADSDALAERSGRRRDP